MRFSILQLLLAVPAIGAAIGIAARDGLFVAFLVALFVTLSIVCCLRANTRWRTSNPAQKVYAAATSVISLLLLACLLYSIGTSESLANERISRNLQSSLARDPRYSRVIVEYFEGKGTWLTVDGTVATESDFEDLRKTVSRYPWKIDALRWDINVTDSKQSYDGWDQDLFGKQKP